MDASTLLAIITTSGASIVAILSALQKFRLSRVDATGCSCDKQPAQPDENEVIVAKKSDTLGL